MEYPGLTRESSCNWVIRGFTDKGWNKLEISIETIGYQTQQMMNTLHYCEKVIQNINKDD